MNPWDQDLCNEKVDWDETSSGYAHAKWLSFHSKSISAFQDWNF